MSKGDMKKVREKFSIGDKVFVQYHAEFEYENRDREGAFDERIIKRKRIGFNGIVVGGQIRYEGKIQESSVDDITSYEVYRYLEPTKQHVLVLVKKTFYGKIYECLPKDVTKLTDG